ncbi:Fc.00g084690.m01.CDS01 [Cosmosporella sp. VM-42]
MPELLDLPAEILSVICHLLCPHCVGERSSLWILPLQCDGRKTLVYSLCSLSLTCRILRAHAQPLLYHRPFMRDDGFIPLIRTLNHRPELALAVRELRIWARWYFELKIKVSAEDLSFLNSLAEFPEATLSSSLRTSSAAPLQAPSPDEPDFQKYTPENALAARILSLIPNVERLEIETYDFWDFPYCQPGSLPRLRELTLGHGGRRAAIDLDAVRGILVAAPALECFWGHRIQGGTSDWIHHKNIKRTVISSSKMELKDLNAMIRGFEALTSLTYDFSIEVGGWHTGEATPREVSETLLIRKDTLKHLFLDCPETCFPPDLQQGDVIKSLKGMMVLETLEVAGPEIYLQDDEETSTDGTYLTNLLPPSIRQFTIKSPHKHLLHDILKLAESAPVLFPELKQVRFPLLELRHREVVETAFTTKGLNVSFERYAEHPV